MANKLYEEASVKNISDALRKKIKSYYTFTDNNTVDNGTYTYTCVNSEGVTCKDSAGGFWYDHNFKIADLAPHSTSESPWKNDLGILKLVSRLGFPDEKKVTFTVNKGTNKYAPDNGWVVASASATRSGLLVLKNVSSGMFSMAGNVASTTGSGGEGTVYNNPLYVVLPCSRYDKITVDSTTNVSYSMNFVPAKKTNTSDTDEVNQYKFAQDKPNTSSNRIGYSTSSSTSTISQYTATTEGWLYYVSGSASYGKCTMQHVGYKNSSGTFVSSANGMIVTCSVVTSYGQYCIMPIAKNSSVTITYAYGSVYFLKAY